MNTASKLSLQVALAITVFTALMKIVRGPLYAWFELERNRVNSSAFFILLSLLIATALYYQ